MTLETPLLSHHARAGAEMGTYFGCTLPARFSSREYDFARKSVALFDTNYQCWAWLDGADRVRYLNAITTNNIKDLAAGHGIGGLLLNPQGHILAEVTTFALADRLLLRSHAMVRARTLETLEKFIIMDDATLADATEQFGSVAFEGQQAVKLAESLIEVTLEGAPENFHAEAQVGGIACRVFRRSHFAAAGVEFLAARDRIDELWILLAKEARRVGGGRIGFDTVNALRLEAGIPWFGHDFDDKVIPHEAGVEQSHISYTKGCYTGQEIVERVRARGQVNRRLTALKFSESTPPVPGSRLFALGAPEKEVGHVTSAAFSPRPQAAIGFAYLRREHAAPGTQLNIASADTTAEVITLPL